ncbi:hypothetical protein D3H64_00175 [Atopobacter sp. AH10]|nr:hypothetical protein D3H64_00175 [Atopobacter sp. AH10]
MFSLELNNHIALKSRVTRGSPYREAWVLRKAGGELSENELGAFVLLTQGKRSSPLSDTVSNSLGTGRGFSSDGKIKKGGSTERFVP